MLVVPAEFNRNDPGVQKMAKPEVTGKLLLDYMAQRLGVNDLGGLDILDFGCGCRFAESIVNLGVPIRTYTGIDLYKPIIDFLDANVEDPRLNFRAVSYYNEMYNPGGEKMSGETRLPVGARKFDVACMFSVITHQPPDDAKSIFSVLRHAIRPSGKLFFSAAVREDIERFEELTAENPGLLTQYHPEFLQSLLRECGWEVVDFATRSPNGLPIMDSYLCRPI